MSDPRPSWDEARGIAATAARLGTERVELADAVRRVLAEDLATPIDLPHYASSAMDGWGGSGLPPWTVRADGPVRAGECVALVTGAAIPDGVDRVLPIENADRVGDRVGAASESPAVGAHIRPAGTEARRGEVLIASGTRLTPAHLGLAAGAARDELIVATRPRIGLVLTGDEVIASGVPEPGRVRDSFTPVLPPVIAELGGTVVAVGRIGDDRAALVAAIASSLGSTDAVITTGGTGRSEVDQLRPALTEIGAELLVDGIRMRPGAPTLLARLPDGPRLLALPGNPLAALLTLISVGGPLLDGMLGARVPPLAESAVVARVEGRTGRTQLIPYRAGTDGAIPVEHRGAGMLRGLAEADGILVVGPEGVEAGERARVLPLPWI